MKTTLWVAAVALMGVLVAGAYAEDAAAVQTATGVVKAVDAEAKKVTVTVDEAELTVLVTDDTKVVQGDEAKTLADIKVGAKVTVEYTKADAGLVASKIAIVE